MTDFYKNDKRNLHVPIIGTIGKKLTKLQRRKEIIHNLENVIRIENAKTGGGNKELCAKFQTKIDAMKEK
tara:strand:+ start:8120 stop:8329 length:210 start_codon:yes stop_codon:yes gene_type:complete